MTGGGEALIGNKLLFAQEFGPEFLFAGEDEFVFGGEKLFIAVEHRVADHRVIFVSTKNDADGGTIIGAAALVIVEAHIHVHLADVLMR
jgi:hypothetical protein